MLAPKTIFTPLSTSTKVPQIVNDRNGRCAGPCASESVSGPEFKFLFEQTSVIGDISTTSVSGALQYNTDNGPMKLLGGTDDGGGRGQPGRSQDDAAVGYEFQRHPHEPEFPQFAPKHPRWATGDDAIIDVCDIH